MNSGSAKPLVGQVGRVGTVEGRSRCMYCLPHLVHVTSGQESLHWTYCLAATEAFHAVPLRGSSVEFGRAIPKDLYYQKGIITSSLGLPSSITDWRVPYPPNSNGQVQSWELSIRYCLFLPPTLLPHQSIPQPCSPYQVLPSKQTHAV